MGREQQEAHFRTLEADPLQSWRVTPLDWKHWRMYDRFVRTAELLIETTSTPEAPWTVVDGMDANYRELTVGAHLRAALDRRLAGADRLDEAWSDTEGSI